MAETLAKTFPDNGFRVLVLLIVRWVWNGR